VQVSCTPASGSAFPLGQTIVSCVASDQLDRRHSCTFSVTLRGRPFGVQRITAFGDSVTEGQNGQALDTVGWLVVDTANAYPTFLQLAFDRDYPGQGITVSNRGYGGFTALRLETEKLAGDLARDRPQALLLLEGYNDLFGLSGAAGAAAAALVADSLRRQIGTARAAGVGHVLLATLTPPGPVTGPVARALDRPTVVEANRLLSQLSAAERVPLVDLYTLFLGREAELVAGDGLHLRPAGNRVVADAFYGVLRAVVAPGALRSGQ
jgi:lysophospholipase L1-like esterase